MIELELIDIRSFLVKIKLKNGQEKFSLSILFWKLILWLKRLKIGLKDLEGKEMIRTFHKNKLLLSILPIHCYPVSESDVYR